MLVFFLTLLSQSRAQNLLGFPVLEIYNPVKKSKLSQAVAEGQQKPLLGYLLIRPEFRKKQSKFK